MSDFLLHNISRYWRLAYVVLAVVLAGLFEVFVWGKKPGLGFLFYIILALVGFISISVINKQFRRPKALFLLIPILVLCLDVFVYNNLITIVLSRPLVLILMILFAVLSTYDNAQKHKFSFLKIPFFGNAFLMFSKIGHVVRDLFIWRESKTQIYRKIVLGIIIALPLLGFFMLFFLSADEVFAESLRNLFAFSFAEEIFARIIRISFLSVFLASLFYVTVGREHVLGEKNISVKKLDSVIVGVILILINALFALFVFFQIKYLFGGAEFVSKSSTLSFAEYARTGFFELVWVLILASLIVLVVYRSLVYHRQHWIIKLLLFVLVAQVFVVAMSALKRMNLYQSEYGFTISRLYVEWFIYFICFLLIVMVVGLVARLQFRNLFYTFLIIGIIAITTVCSLNVDLMIANKNISLAINQGKELDVIYLYYLSLDMSPSLKLLSDSVSKIKLRGNLPDYPDYQRIDIPKLVERSKESVKDVDSFLEFNWGRFQAREILKNL